jgi:hypothetical protein
MNLSLTFFSQVSLPAPISYLKANGMVSREAAGPDLLNGKRRKIK